MSISALIQKLRHSVEDQPLKPVGEWKRSHPDGKAIGCFPVYVPVEIVHAAGMLPVSIAGASSGTKLDHANSFLQAFVCSIARSTLELELEGKLSELDGFVFPSGCEIPRGLSGVWERRETDKPIVYLHFPQNIASPSALDFMVGELTRLRSLLEELGGCEISDEALLGSFRIYNERAGLLDKLDSVRCDHPEKLKASEFYILGLSGLAIPPEDHIALLNEALGAIESAAGRPAPKLRMALMGAFCERPPVAMLEVIEGEGVAIVSDDILLGQRWWTEPIRTSGDPMTLLAEHYLRHSPITPLTHTRDEVRCDAIIETIKRSRADGLIFASPKFCHPSLHDAACVVRTCEDNGIPYLRFEYEEEMAVFESIRMQVEALLEARAALPFAGVESNKETAKEG